jgi:hypothetical protein
LVKILTKTPFVIIAVVLISFAVTFAALYVFVLQPFLAQDNSLGQIPSNSPTPSSPNLSAARNLVGTWKTSFPTTFNIKTDFSSADLVDVGSEDRVMTWVITSASDQNTVNIKVSFTTSNRNFIADSGFTPDVSPMFLTGTISGTRLTLHGDDGVMGQFSFTSTIIKGAWDDTWTAAYSQQAYTATDGLILSKQ